jgi:hypothetical protein
MRFLLCKALPTGVNFLLPLEVTLPLSLRVSHFRLLICFARSKVDFFVYRTIVAGNRPRLPDLGLGMVFRFRAGPANINVGHPSRRLHGRPGIVNLRLRLYTFEFGRVLLDCDFIGRCMNKMRKHDKYQEKESQASGSQ